MSLCRFAAAVCTLLLAACATSPAPRLHQLDLPAARPLAAAGLALLIGPVQVPEAVDRPQFVLTGPDGQLALRDDWRWAQTYKGEFARAFAAQLAERLGSARVLPYGTVALDAPRLGVTLLRVDTQVGGEVLIEAVCTLQRGSLPPLIHRSTLRQSGGGDASALVASHSALVARLAAELIAAWPQLAQP